MSEQNTSAALTLLGLSVPLLCQLENLSAIEDLTALPSQQRAAAGQINQTPEAMAMLLELKARSPAQYLDLQENLLCLIAQQLPAAGLAGEPPFMALLIEVANALTYAPERFSNLIRALDNPPLMLPDSRHWLDYFTGLAEGFQDRYGVALQRFAKLLAEPALDQFLRGRILNSSAIYYELTGQFQASVDSHRASLAIWRALGNQEREAISLLNLGIALQELHLYAESEMHLLEAGQYFSESGATRHLISVQNHLGLLYRDLGRWEEALTFLQRAAAGRRQEGNRDSLGRALQNIGVLQLLRGVLTEASHDLQTSLAYLETDLYRIDAYLYLGLIAQIEGNWEAAYNYYVQAQTLVQHTNQGDLLAHAQVRSRLAGALQQMGRTTAARTMYQTALALIESSRRPLREEKLKISLFGRWQQIYEAAVLQAVACGEIETAFLYVEQARARAFADLILQSNTPTERPATLAELQNQLPADAALLCFYTTGVLLQDQPFLQKLPPAGPLRQHLAPPPHTFLFAITQSEITFHVCPIDPNDFVTDTTHWGESNHLLDPEVLQSMGQLLLAPVISLLNLSKLYIIPHGPLHQAPFDALIEAVTAPGVQLPALAYAPSITVLLRHCLPAASEPLVGHGLAIGYDSNNLQHSEAEASFVAALLEGEAWVGAQPKKRALPALTAARPWLHFACHGEFDTNEPMDSFLEVGRNERLTALEIAQEWRLQARLVTLSACQTGMARILRGDEPMGLVRAFLAAGAKAALVTQWPVEDLPTFLLMQRFYQEASQTKADLAAALRQAQQWLRQLTGVETATVVTQLSIRTFQYDQVFSQSRPFAHPQHWAGFRLIGA